ncbi:hypothetical protein BAOM_3136 [Peribacillus asahii]|uniref:Uncharacterized protein n=1 Tax=Peribacillus asahii TaxID=228899 RepID=A0A3Q9RP94_9BACI|nr:hypothetical protein [Peribacillus asahii]AZV43745.1 hypothetical protein BAOM_3136 [Peribacillus asahii]
MDIQVKDFNKIVEQYDRMVAQLNRENIFLKAVIEELQANSPTTGEQVELSK